MELEVLEVKDSVGWCAWLANNHLTNLGVWLVFRRQATGRQSISYEEALDEALAYGWIDSVIRKIDSQRYARKFTPRRPSSLWSNLNIRRVKTLSAEGRMTKWGLEAFSKRTSKISALEKITKEGVRIPKDLKDAIKANKRASVRFQGFAPSHKMRYLVWISAAKRPETRKRRIAEAVVLISRNVKNLLR